jgi:UDP-N-acetylglucosamine acyltransferase
VIHATAIIHPKAKLDPTVRVGPYSVIDEGVEIGAGCVIGPHVYLTGNTLIGVGNQFYAGCIVGEAPQDLKYAGAPTRLRMGDHNVVREHVTIHRSSDPSGETLIGSNNFLMQHSHVAHNVILGNAMILGGGAMLAGYVTVGDRAFISGNCLVHQFVRVGSLALMQGGSGISKDLPPYTVARGANGICGLNTIGLRRAGMTSSERLELKQVYRVLFREGSNLGSALASARNRFTSIPARLLMDFIASSKRGVCFEVSNGAPEADSEAD